MYVHMYVGSRMGQHAKPTDCVCFCSCLCYWWMLNDERAQTRVLPQRSVFVTSSSISNVFQTLCQFRCLCLIFPFLSIFLSPLPLSSLLGFAFYEYVVKSHECIWMKRAYPYQPFKRKSSKQSNYTNTFLVLSSDEGLKSSACQTKKKKKY